MSLPAARHTTTTTTTTHSAGGVRFQYDVASDWVAHRSERRVQRRERPCAGHSPVPRVPFPAPVLFKVAAFVFDSHGGEHDGRVRSLLHVEQGVLSRPHAPPCLCRGHAVSGLDGATRTTRSLRPQDYTENIAHVAISECDYLVDIDLNVHAVKAVGTA